MSEPLNENEAQLYGAITALQFMIENHYALTLRLANASMEDVRGARDEFLRQFEDLPERNKVAEVNADAFVIRQHALARLERMWAAIEGRLEQ